MNHVIRGDIWLMNLETSVKGESAHRTMPAVIVSPAEIHDYLNTIVVAPISTEAGSAPYRIPVHVEGEDGLILLDQITSVNKEKLILKLGVVEADTLIDSLEILQETFAL